MRKQNRAQERFLAPKAGCSSFALLFFLILSILCAQIFAAQTYTEEKLANAPSFGNFMSAWLSPSSNGFLLRLPLLAAALVLGIVSLAFMAGNFLQNEELKTFAKEEMVQALSSVLLIGLLIGTVIFVDNFLASVTGENAASNNYIASPCPAGYDFNAPGAPPRTVQYAACYIDNLLAMAKTQARSALIESIDAGRQAYRNIGYQSDTWILAYTGMAYRPNAYMRLDMETKGQELDHLSRILFSLGSQEFLLQKIIPVLGPVAILIGLVLRSLFFTRKYGGLFIAAGFGLLIVFPATYLLSWATLQVSVFGAQAIGTGESNPACPSECKVLPPLAYDLGKNAAGNYAPDTMLSNSDFRAKLDTINNERAKTSKSLLKLGSEIELKQEYQIQTCFPKYPDGPAQTQAASSPVPTVASNNCPLECRYLPTPVDAQCNQTACDLLPNACKLARGIGMINYTDYVPKDSDAGQIGYCKNNCPDKISTDGSPACPQACLGKVSEVKWSEDNKVVPSANGGKCNVDASANQPDDCKSCPAYCRNYFTDLKDSNGNWRMLHASTPDCNSAACTACLAKKDSGTPDCMTGVASISAADCDDSSLCGRSRRLEDVVDLSTGAIKMAGVCPTECRIYFESKDAAYKDPNFIKYCEENKNILNACNQCPVSCKTDANKLPLGAGQTDSFRGSSSSGISATCSPPPRFTVDGSPNGAPCTTSAGCKVVDENYNNNCARCPMSCRFSNPPAINDNVGSNAFKSSAHYPIECIYLSDAPVTVTNEDGSKTDYPGVKITYHSNSNNPSCPYNNPDPPVYSPSGTPYKISFGIPACSPAQQIYARADIGLNQADNRCPVFYTPSDTYFFVSQTTQPNLIHAIAKPNQEGSGECVGADALKYCSAPYCDANACMVDRKSNGPFYCNVTVDDQYSTIPENKAKYCRACAKPECEVMLTSSSDSKVYYPYGCPAGGNANCAPGTVSSADNSLSSIITDPKSSSACNGFCYPRLEIPVDGQTCKAFEPNTLSDGERSNRTMGNALACPMSCRYDYKNGPDSASIPDAAKSWCGYDTGSMNLHDCDPTCRGDLTPSDGTHMSACAAEGYACQDAGSGAGAYWVRSPLIKYPQPSSSSDYCSQNVVLNTSGSNTYADGEVYHNGACTAGEKSSGNYRDSTSAPVKCLHNKNWYEAICPSGVSFGTIQYGYTPKTCTPRHKYQGLDSLASAAGVSNYYECGDVSLNGANPDYNFCGAYTAVGNGQSGTVSGMDESCKARYNARAVACLPYASYTNDMGPPSDGSLSPDKNCQQCPTFCRIGGGGADNVCNKDILGGLGPNCNSNQCDKDANAPSLTPPGNCGVDASLFNLNGGACLPYKGGVGMGCPARCRILVPGPNGDTLPAGCDTPDIGDACSLIKLPSACRGAAGGASPCNSCTACDVDCTALPYVRTSCADLCSPADIFSGASAASPADLLSSFKGASATMTSWQSIGSLYIPAVLLPIFGAILLIAFVRALSPALGGDIEIPGLYKLI